MSTPALPAWLVNLYALHSLEWRESTLDEHGDMMYALACSKCGYALHAVKYSHPDRADVNIAWYQHDAQNHPLEHRCRRQTAGPG